MAFGKPATNSTSDLSTGTIPVTSGSNETWMSSSSIFLRCHRTRSRTATATGSPQYEIGSSRPKGGLQSYSVPVSDFDFCDRVTVFLEREKTGYRILENQLVPITDPVELSAVSEAASPPSSFVENTSNPRFHFSHESRILIIATAPRKLSARLNPLRA